MNDFAKGMFIVLVLLYVVAPDACPGPIDDLIVAIIGFAASKKQSIDP